MWIIGCDLHTRYQQVAAVNTRTGESIELRLEHAGDRVRAFYAGLERPVRVGIEAVGPTDWFERLLDELGYELWVGDAARIRAGVVRQQKNDVNDARQLLRLLLEERFPRIWVPAPSERDTRQLLVHRAKLVQIRTGLRNQLQAMALGQGLRRGRGLWSARGRAQLEHLSLAERAGERRRDLLALTRQLDARIQQLDAAVAAEAQRRPEARLLLQQPGVGPVTALAFVLTIGPVERFRRSKQVVSYLGLNPREHSSGGRQRLGHISKQGNTMMRWLLVEAGQSAAQRDAELHRCYARLKFRRGANIAKVAVARRLAVRLFWVLRRAGKPKPTQPASRQGSPSTVVVGNPPSSF